METIKNIKLPDGNTYKIGGLDDKITNCITEIPQDIKLELNNGVLTLKAGSKVYVPNGFEADGTTPKFDEVVVDSDISATPGHSSTEAHFLYARSNNSLFIEQVDQSFSGNTAPTGYTYAKWYDTANNLMKATSDGGSTWTSGHSLPLCIYHTENSVVKSIDQTFNGFGYIGSTIFVTKGVKGLIPNGRNEDGTLRNIEFITDKLLTRTMTTENYNAVFAFSDNGISRGDVGYCVYDEKNNYNLSAGNIWDVCIFAQGKLTNGVISNLQSKYTFRAVDYSDKSTVSGWGMPSNKYIDLTLGASGTTYKAPANGWVTLWKTPTADGQSLQAEVGECRFGVASVAKGSTWLRISFPVKKGDDYIIAHTAGGTTQVFRFIYAEGEV